MLTTSKINDFVQVSTFSTPTGCEEIFLTIQTRPEIILEKALEEVAENYSLARKKAGLSGDTVVFSRLFVSDIIHQKKTLVRSSVFQQLTKGALSVIEQKPVNGGPLSLLSYHIFSEKKTPDRQCRHHSPEDPDGWQNSAAIKGNNYSLLFTANFTSDAAPDTYGQTKTIFESLEKVISSNGMLLTDDTIRTWVFVRDIDAHYSTMVKARKDFFTALGLTEKTRYLASTGIQGDASSPDQIVSIDSLSIGGLQPRQIVRMEAPTHLSPTIQYGVTFERGLRVRFGDRSHLYISGTASIGNKGEVLFSGDAGQQTRRTVENIRALLAPHNASFDDMAYVIAYVRNFHDRESVGDVLRREIGRKIPRIFAEASVCRPAWLVELEGLAIIPDKTEFPPFL